ncbi:hypothetical protein GCM10009127_00520 [Alteraurantiacibacter aestuarii]|uniref:OmpA family protein n=1 Tax=Alteraurantiacibacter aestuarii TaxID=650004 RepID=A0A844ZJQ6_9SPHN|nr:OmpA family protein [Alteraurantiacibacter aestuarii]MXO88691.1 OmpA family protein [Alteraurantiacibacter aestuarii]
MDITPGKLIMISAAALLVSACELRQEGGGEPEPATSGQPADPAPTSTATTVMEETPAASIIRDDARREELATPVEALKVTVPLGNSGNELGADAQQVLREVLESDALREGWPVILRGHTDSSGNDSANLRASRSRAEAVAAWLVERGVDDERITVIAFGEQNPIAPNALPNGMPDEAGRARNRRVEIEIAPETGPAPSSAP